MTTINYQQLAEALIARTKAASSTPTSYWGHGNPGVFNHPALERPFFSAMVMPKTGLKDILPIRTSMYSDPLYGIITGQTANSGSNADGVCDDPPTVGNIKLCKTTAPFGRFALQTEAYNIDRFGEMASRGEHNDFQVYGGIGDAPPTLPGANFSNAANRDIALAFFKLRVAWLRTFAAQTFTGNPANNSSNDGYMEFYGLDYLINAGYRDAITGVACPAADSRVLNFGGADVTANGATMVNYIVSTHRYLHHTANRTGLAPLNYALVMAPQLFWAIADIWPCAYNTTKCSPASDNTGFVDTTYQIEMRDAMRAGNYLLIDNVQVPVITDDAITETESGGLFSSSIYFVPMTVQGNVPVTYYEYLNYDGPDGAMDAARAFGVGSNYRTTDGGAYLIHYKPPTNLCVQVAMYARPRLVMRTPYLAARIDDVAYSTLLQTRDYDPDGTYFYNGGDTVGTAWSFYGPRS